jgi:hypothetical protein
MALTSFFARLRLQCLFLYGSSSQKPKVGPPKHKCMTNKLTFPGLSLEAMDALFGVVPHDELAMERGELGAVKNLRKSVEKDMEVEQVEKDS